MGEVKWLTATGSIAVNAMLAMHYQKTYGMITHIVLRWKSPFLGPADKWNG
jgi:hypothetical protein